ncbi:MAG: hypothetical protein AAFP90_24190, partial [Planctomycetota bacterium]
RSKAISSISQITQDKDMYDAREKAQRDCEWAMSSSRKEGREERREEGREKGRQEGREEVRRDGSIRTINMLHEILNLAPMPDDEFAAQTSEALEKLQSDLAKQIRERRAGDADV